MTRRSDTVYIDDDLITSMSDVSISRDTSNHATFKISMTSGKTIIMYLEFECVADIRSYLEMYDDKYLHGYTYDDNIKTDYMISVDKIEYVRRATNGQ
jgi:hypothetical protein